MARICSRLAGAGGLAEGLVAEHHAPRQVGHPPPELAIDEVGDASEEQAEGHAGRDQIAQPQHVDLVGPGEQDDGHDHADHAAVEGHAAVPDLEHHQRMGEQLMGVVEDHRSQPPAHDRAEGQPQNQVVELGRGRRRFARAPELGGLHQPHAVAPAQGDADDIGQGVPAHADRADVPAQQVELIGPQERDVGIDVRKQQHARISSRPMRRWAVAGSDQAPLRIYLALPI